MEAATAGTAQRVAPPQLLQRPAAPAPVKAEPLLRTLGGERTAPANGPLLARQTNVDSLLTPASKTAPRSPLAPPPLAKRETKPETKAETKPATAEAAKPFNPMAFLSNPKAMMQSFVDAGKSLEKKAREVHTARHNLIDEANQDKEKTGNSFDLQKDVTTLYTATKGQVWTDNKAVKELYWDRTPKQIQAMEATYGDRFARAAGEDLKELDGHDTKIVDALRKGDRVGAATLQMLDGGRNNNQDLLEDTLRKLKPEERKTLAESFKGPNGENLETMLRSKVKGERGQEALALLRGDEAAANLSQLRQNFSGDKDGDVLKQLRGIEPGKEKEFVAAFNQGGGDLTAEINRRLHGDERAQALALINGNRPAADAARIHSRQWGDERADLWESLGDHIKDPQERKVYLDKVQTEFNNKYAVGDTRNRFQSFINKDLNAEDKAKFNNILTQGEIPDQDKLKYALSGDKKDGKEVAALVQRLGPDEAKRVYQQATNGRDLEQDIKDRLGGNDRFEAEQSLKGVPTEPEQMLERARERVQFESGGFGLFTDADEIMQKNLGRAEDALKSLQSARSEGDQEKIDFYKRRVAELTGYSVQDAEMYKGEKEGAGEIAATVATTAAAVAVTAATGGTAAPLLAAAAGAAAGTVSNVATQAVFQGNGYDWHTEGVEDAFTGAVMGATGGIGAVEGAALKAGAQKMVQSATTSRLAGQAAGAVSDGVVSNALSSAASSAVMTAADGSTWSNGFGVGVAKLAGTVTADTLGGAATGGVMSPGQEAVLGTVAKGFTKKVQVDGPAARPEVEVEAPKADSLDPGPTVLRAEVSPSAVAAVDVPVPASKTNLSSRRPEAFSPEEVVEIRQKASDRAIEELERLRANGQMDGVKRSVASRPKLQEAVDSGELTLDQAYLKIEEASLISGHIRARSQELVDEAVKSGRISQAEADLLPRSGDPLMGRLSGPFREEMSYSSNYAGVTGLQKGTPTGDDLTLVANSRVVNHILEADAPRTVDGQTTVYGSQRAREVALVQQAKSMMSGSAPGLGEHLGEVHLSNVIERKAQQERTAGRMFTSDRVASHDSAIDVLRPPVSQVIKGADGLEKRVAPLSGEEKFLFTTIHETLHLKDGKTGWNSKNSIFGKGDDFATTYARQDAYEDYAETGTFLISMDHGLPYPDSDGVKLTPGLRDKLAASAQSMGAKPGVLEHTLAALEMENRVVDDLRSTFAGKGAKDIDTAKVFFLDGASTTSMHRSPDEFSASELWSRADGYEKLGAMTTEQLQAKGFSGSPENYRDLAQHYHGRFDQSIRQDVRASTAFVRRFQQGVEDGSYAFQKVDDSVLNRVRTTAEQMGVGPAESRRMWLHLKFSGQADSLGAEMGLKSADEYREFGNFFRTPPQDVTGWARFDALSQQVYPQMSAEARREMLTAVD